jgi:hypothetical protein
MWKRKTFHECANELASVSERFRLAHTNTLPSHLKKHRSSILEECSKDGVDILKILALSIRSEQDYDILPKQKSMVGAFKEPVTDGCIYVCKSYFRGQYEKYCKTKNFLPLNLRTALNKIAHVNPDESSFYATEHAHGLILVGSNRDKKWVALIDLLALITVVKELPDEGMRSCND